MESLSVLNLFANQLTTLPQEISNCKNIRMIDLKLNPIKEDDKYKIRRFVEGAEVKFDTN